MTSPVEQPVDGLPGLDPRWSRFLTVADASGQPRRWHVLDNGVGADGGPVEGTMLCVHGNPTWSYLWRRFLSEAPAGWRVVAVDQLGMGWSTRRAPARRLGDRIDDLGRLTDALDLQGPVVLAAHDWGGLVGLGWALEHREQLAGVVLTNTAVFQPLDQPFSALIRLARTPALRQLVCVTTPTFVQGAAALSRPSLDRDVRRALAGPYADASERAAIGDFVADVPLERHHPSRLRMEQVAEGIRDLDVPALLLWGGRDPVFTDLHLADLVDRLPHADVHRFGRASHLVTEDVPETAEIAWRWVDSRVATAGAAPSERPPAQVDRSALWAPISERATSSPDAPAVVELHDGVVSRTSFGELEQGIVDLAHGLVDLGVRRGDRVAVLVTPGLGLTTAVFACWRVGAVVVVADAGLGVRGMAHALRGARPDHVIGIPKAVAALDALRVPGRRIVAGDVSAPVGAVLRHPASVTSLTVRGGVLRTQGAVLPDLGGTDEDVAVFFTSGATGPAKGVVYRAAQLQGQVARLAGLYAGDRDDAWVAAFPLFSLYGPAMGTAAAVPDMDPTRAGTLTASALADAAAAVDGRVVFASPAALRNVVATAGALTDAQREALTRVRVLMSAGAPVPVGLLRRVQALVPNADLHTPYGMTEVLPVADITLPGIEAAGAGDGVCVGLPVPGVTVRLAPLDATGRATGELTTQAGVTGEILVDADHRKQRYDRLWATERASSRDPGHHRTGDVGHLDDEGRLWVEGRLVHVLSTPDGPLTPVGVEQRVETLPEVASAAVVGVGPAGTQQVVVVVVPVAGASARRPLAAGALAAAVREVAGVDVAAVLAVPALPTDIRHNSKIDRAAVRAWASRVLTGERAGRLA
ncbi:Acyl-CoA synthetase (AMP-forming)/AMP-acid ligase II [Microlunatus sagamiharensis]|uniref:Acyl-CoA synthetase (AMP-forming)/AMP-acid ligase II n=1 Tax=Microlunatus sagamiharensis TaxID=546874 RepID=A0A1H2M5V3_9ACTN|nr:alpha/beta fold hydrolase [Microlunatus sagamiharensis]SDU88623.1 Acyl-CoA synthetase (AMP-forming)/AMP-acid ligase II [Microlunatus sagamiharensis]